MQISFDLNKSEVNILERGLTFDLVKEFDFETALFAVDNRRDYGEIRIRALGRLNNRVHALVFVKTSSGIRVISFRKANTREVTLYEQKTAN